MFFYEKQIKAKKKTILSNYVLFHMYSRHIHVETPSLRYAKNR
jgi:hypothetical protein